MKNLNTLLLIAFLLSSCAPIATAASASTPIPATSTLIPTPTPTNTPAPTDTSTPTITSTPLPITFIYQDNVPADARALQEQAAYKAYTYYSQFVDLGEITIYTFSDLDLFIEELSPVLVANGNDVEQFQKDWENIGGSSIGDTEVINSGYPAWLNDQNLCFRAKNLIHEMFHTTQRKLLKQMRHNLNNWGPNWIAEGSPEVLGYKLAENLNQCTAENSDIAYWRKDASLYKVKLAQFEDNNAFSKPEFYSVSALAVDYLIQITPNGEMAIMEYYSKIGDGEEWHNAFLSSFDLSVEDFYIKFEDVGNK